MNALKSALRGAFVVSLAGLATFGAILVHDNWPKKYETARVQMVLGGSLFGFIEDYSKARTANTRFIIDGLCVSACTMILGEIPNDRVCVTPYAKLGFHAAFTLSFEGRTFSKEGTSVLWTVYPPKVRDMLRAHGWAGPDVDQPDLIWIEGDELLLLFKPCIED